MLTLVSNNPTTTQSYIRYQEAMKLASTQYDNCIASGMAGDQASRQLSRDIAQAWAEYQAGRIAQPFSARQLAKLRLVK